ncbi:MAG: DNA repair protein SbcC/Rad50 [Methyloprofundus sp.]|nr:MAG: DNA repair protein SbcC/Rad50 [Methyloprofundus sp.]
MRILAIRGKNLASLANEFEVLLEAGTLQKVGLFAITGPTGAGKSTILDALCLALYDQMPRLPEGHGVAIGHKDEDEAVRVKSHDVSSILRRGTASAFAEVDFIGQDKQSYRARWELSRARNKVGGRLQAQRMSLVNINSQEKFGQGKKDTQQEIVKRLGLNFAQFRRSVLLAQGDFAAFLKAKKDERSSLLEKITGTDIYSELSIAAFERAKLEKLHLDNIQEKLADKVPLTTEARAELNNEHLQLSEQLTALQQQQKIKQLILDWFTCLAKLTVDQQQAQQQCQQQQESWNDNSSDRELLTQVELVQPLRPLLQQVLSLSTECAEAQLKLTDSETTLIKAEQTVNDVSQQVQIKQQQFVRAESSFNAAQPILIIARELDTKIANSQARLQDLQQEVSSQQEKWQTADAKVTELSTQQEQQRQQLQQLQIWQEQHMDLQAVANEWGRWESNIQDYLAQQQALIEQQANHTQLENNIAAQQTELSSLQTASELCLAKEQQLSAELLALEQQSDSQALSDLHQQQAQLETQQAECKSTVSLAEQGLALQLDLHNTQTALTTNEQTLQQANTQIEQLIVQQDNKQGQLQEAQHAFNLMHAASQKTAQDLRALLMTEQPCPVCGANEHPWADTHLEVLQQPVAEQQARVEQLTAAKEQLVSELSTQQSLVKQAKQEQGQLTKTKQHTEQRLNELAKQWLLIGLENKPTWLNLQAADITQLQQQSARLHAQYIAIKNQVSLALDLQTQITAVRSQRDAANQQHIEQRLKTTELDKNIAEQLSTLAANSNSIQQLETKLLHIETILNTPLQQLDNWQTELSEAGADFLQQLRDSMVLWQNNSQQQELLNKDLNQIKHDLAIASTAAEQQHHLGLQLQQELQQHNTQQQDLLTDRQQYCQGLPANDYARNVEQQLQTAGNHKQQAEAELSTAHSETKTWQSTVQHWQTEQQRRLAKQDSTEQELQTELSNLQLTKATAQELLSKDADWITTQKQQSATLTQALQEAQANLKVSTTHLQEHEQHTPLEQESLVITQLEKLQSEYEILSSEKDNKIFLLRSDDEKIAAGNHLQAQLSQQTHIYEQWESLNELIGSKSGQKFRTFAQSLTLETLLSYTNRHLQEFAKRYVLQRVPGSELELQVIDRDMADEVRSIHSLSGGESFLVALALALGLASLSSNKTQVESLFIDEGFGSLDQETLDIALASLDTLQSLGRKVGVISHVPALVERIGAQVVVEKQGGGQSVVSVRAYV